MSFVRHLNVDLKIEPFVVNVDIECRRLRNLKELIFDFKGLIDEESIFEMN